MRKYKTREPFIGLHSSTFFSEDFLKLSDKAKVLYLALKATRNSDGKVCLPYRKIYKWPGWRNMNTIRKVYAELEKGEWIRRCDVGGGLFKKATAYELTLLKDNFGLKKEG